MSVWEEFQVVKRGREYHGCMEYNVGKRTRGRISRGEGDRNFREENQDFKKMEVVMKINL